ncbi:MAG TPA: DUF6395 domain-containing protein [Polyangia bacterium]|jgi:hypothetical protein
MRVDVEREAGGFRYRVTPEADDRLVTQRQFTGVAEDQITLVNREYRVALPPAFTEIHGDCHAAAVFFVLLPFVGRSLTLPFAASRRLATRLGRRYGVSLTNVDDGLAPRAAPAGAPPSLLLSGGADSVAVSQILPDDTHHLFLDRIAHPESAPQGPDKLVDLAASRAVCDRLRALGRTVHVIGDEHEHLYQPYPVWHNEMSGLAALYLADSLGLATTDSGDVLCQPCFGGYHDGRVAGWPFRPFGPTMAAILAFDEDPAADLPPGLPPTYALPMAAGLRRGASALGLSQVATTIILNRGPMRRRAFSCYYPPAGDESFCLHCDKCFMKLLLSYVVEGTEVPAELFADFLRHPHLAKVFARPYFDWHHIWYYLFQKMRCAHPFARALHEQARGGPDLAVLEKWYPVPRPLIPAAYRDECEARIRSYVDVMTDAEVAYLERLDVPPLHAPALAAA